ncbi:MAG: glycoside hydrolase [Balneola sp.]|jgi:endoglucanase|nr:glycoside hydrolase [Balneola sp.]MBE79810.1 glycoside hydrolase [Balneola sp.]|tara:strand:+ start:370 stop:1518 length:1149 start_codon:yes stop_codon:yes gene_type:complete
MKLQTFNPFKKANMKLLVVSAAYFLLMMSCSDKNPSGADRAEEVPTAHEMVIEMGLGFNLGNTYDNGYNSTDFESTAPIIAKYDNAGMQHVRIPTTWLEGFGGNTLADENGNVDFDNPRFLELKKTIDFALDRGLYVVLNAHHERGFKEHYDGSAEYNDKFTNLWTDIAEYFKDYDHHLIFELLNEPEGAFGGGGSVNQDSEIALQRTRQIMNVGVTAIRATGGNNGNRLVMIATNGLGNQSQLEDVYPNIDALPGQGSDKYLSIQVHSYDPWEFCGQNGSNSAYPGDEATANIIKRVAAHGRELNVPINLGEFGVGRDGDQQSRDTDLVRGYYQTMVQVAKDEGMSTSVWDDQGWFGLITGSPSNGYSFVYDIVPTMLSEN